MSRWASENCQHCTEKVGKEDGGMWSGEASGGKSGGERWHQGKGRDTQLWGERQLEAKNKPQQWIHLLWGMGESGKQQHGERTEQPRDWICRKIHSTVNHFPEKSLFPKQGCDEAENSVETETISYMAKGSWLLLDKCAGSRSKEADKSLVSNSWCGPDSAGTRSKASVHLDHGWHFPEEPWRKAEIDRNYIQISLSRNLDTTAVNA